MSLNGCLYFTPNFLWQHNGRLLAVTTPLFIMYVLVWRLSWKFVEFYGSSESMKIVYNYTKINIRY